MESNSIQQIDLVIQASQSQQDMYFLSNSRKYKTIRLSGKEEEEYYVLDNPVPETLSPWVELSVLDNRTEEKTSLDISSKSYGLKPSEAEALMQFINRIRKSLKMGSSISMSLNSVLDLSEWVIHLE